MSRRSGSNINSPAFMKDPVTLDTSKNTGAALDSDKTVLIKGDKNELSDVYEHVGGEEDVYIIKGQGTSFQLHRKTLKETLNELKTHSHVSIKHLKPEHAESFRSIVDALRLLYGSQALYNLILTDIKSVFSDVKDIKPGTLAAFFIGCFHDNKFPGPLGCSPKCASSLTPPDGTPGYNACEDLVLIYLDGTFNSLNEKKTQHAYIYVGEGQFLGFTAENIKQLADAGIVTVTLIYGNVDGSYREMANSVKLDLLPIKNVKTVSSKVSTNSSDSTSSSSSSNSTAAVVFIIVILIILILLVLLAYAYNKRMIRLNW